MIDAARMHLALNFEQNYVTPFYVFLTSVFENNAGSSFTFHVITSGLPAADEAGLKSYVQAKGSELVFYSPQNFAADFTNHGFSRATFYRLLFASLLPPEVTKFLYIDVDVVVIGKLRELYDTDTQGLPLAAVPEPSMQFRPDLGHKEGDLYFNAGVLLIDRVRWNQQQISERAIAFLQANHQRIPYADQDALNATLVGNWRPLSPRFNVMSIYVPHRIRKQAIADFLRDKVVIHYTHTAKPWHAHCSNRLRFLYYKYLRLSPVPGTGRPIDFEWKPRLLVDMLKIKGWEWYDSYPLVPLRVVNRLRGLRKPGSH